MKEVVIGQGLTMKGVVRAGGYEPVVMRGNFLSWSDFVARARKEYKMVNPSCRWSDIGVTKVDGNVTERCFCDRNHIGEPGVSCGDCPRNYKRSGEV